MLDRITFKRSASTAGLYYIRAYGWYVGTVRKQDGLWSVTPTGGVASEAIHHTRKAAVESIMPFITVEVLARTHWNNATSEDRTISAGDSPIYLASRRALVEGIAATYPDMNAQEVYYEWTGHGETILQTVRSMRQEAEDLAAYQAEVEAEEAAYQAQQDAKTDTRPPVKVPDYSAVAAIKATTEPRTRQAAFLVTSEPDGSTRVTVGMMSPDMPTDKATGVTKTGIPFNVFTLDYMDAGRAWRMVDVLAKELREWRLPFHVAIVGTRPDKAYEGTVYAGATACCHDQALYLAPTYRAAGFPSLDAAIGADYARR